MGQRDGMTGAEDLQYELILRTLTGTTESLDGGHRNSKYVVAPNVELTYYVGIQTVSRGCLILFYFYFYFYFLVLFWESGEHSACTEFSKKESVLSVLCALFKNVAHSYRLRRRIPTA